MEHIINTANECYSIYGFYPISFSFTHKIDNYIPIKEKDFATVIPGDYKTYIFNTEDRYYKDYQISKFGLTKCKSGWDCMRHLEIIANKCLPLFENSVNIPKYTMIHHSKELYNEINNKKEELLEDKLQYNLYITKLINHFNSFLIGEEMTNYILKVINKENVKKILFIDSYLCYKHTDYLSMMIHNGFKMKFKENCEVMYPCDNFFLYEKNNLDTSNLYGKGFSYVGKLPIEYMSEYEKNKKYDENFIKENIKKHTYDLIIYGAVHWSMDHLDFIKLYYSNDEILGFQGQDDYTESEIEFIRKHITLFVREPGRILRLY